MTPTLTILAVYGAAYLAYAAFRAVQACRPREAPDFAAWERELEDPGL